MSTPNEITAFVAILMLGLAAWGYRGSIIRGGPETAVDWLMRGICIGALVICLRLTTWDVVISTLATIMPDSIATLQYIGNLLNAVWNACLAYAAYAALRGLHLFIPEEDRGNWSVWTSAFYPEHPWRKIGERIVNRLWR